MANIFKRLPKIQSLSKKKQILSESCLRWQKQNPTPKCELYYETPYQLLISVVLSAQATDKIVNRYMTPLYKNGLTPDTIIAMKTSGIFQEIKSIGLANTKAKNIYELTKKIIHQHHYKIPKVREDLEKLPGVGRKTANVILAELYGEPTLAVDTHVLRVSTRLGLHREINPNKVEKKLLDLIDTKFLPAAHHWLILHGRYTCKAIKPQCEKCILKDLCPSFANFQQSSS